MKPSRTSKSLFGSPEHHMGLLEYRLAWARNYLKNIGALANSARGVWTITPLGREIQDSEDAIGRVKAYKAEYNRAYYAAKRQAGEQVVVGEDDESDEEVAEVESEV